MIIFEKSFEIFRSSEKNFPIAYVFPRLVENYGRYNTQDKELKVFIMNDDNEDELKASLKRFIELFSMRQKTDREFWLVDITALMNSNGMQGVLDALKDLKLDLDDDLYLYGFEKDQPMIKLYEFYEIHSQIPKQILPFGSWSEVEGLKLPGEGKWVRRRNLQVSHIDLKSKVKISERFFH